MNVKLLKFWLLGIVSGIGVILIYPIEISAVFVLHSAQAIFLKNFTASMTTIFLGVFLCYAELEIYKNVSKETYEFLESLTSPLYKILGILDPTFKHLKPFFRSCFFYLLFVPALSLYINGAVIGLFIHARDYALLYPHGLLEIPAILFSAFLGLSFAEEFKSPLLNADLAELEKRMSAGLRAKLIPALLIQILLLISAVLEAMPL